MRQQIRLRFLLPLLVVAVGGLGVAKLGLGPLDTGTGDEPATAAAPAATAEATAPAETATGTTTDAGGGATGDPAAEAAAAQPANTGEAKLEAALKEEKVVVLVVYSPDAAVDSLVTREARLAAGDVGAGFVSVNAAKEKQIAELALAYDLRSTPVVLVFERGPELVTRLAGYVDRETVAQAAQDAKR